MVRKIVARRAVAAPSANAPVKRGPGRPRKNPLPVVIDEAAQIPQEALDAAAPIPTLHLGVNIEAQFAQLNANLHSIGQQLGFICDALKMTPVEVAAEKKTRKARVAEIAAALPAAPTSAPAAAADVRDMAKWVCKDCGAQLDKTNSSVLKTGVVAHVGCPADAAPAAPAPAPAPVALVPAPLPEAPKAAPVPDIDACRKAMQDFLRSGKEKVALIAIMQKFDKSPEPKLSNIPEAQRAAFVEALR